MKNKTLLGILIILIVISVIFVKVDSADVNPKEVAKNETESATNVPKDDLIYSNKFLVKGKTISRIDPKTTIEDFRNNIEVTKGKEVKIYKGEKEITSGYIGTGMLVKGTDGQEYTTSVTGDLIGDGRPNQVELTMMIRHIIDLKDWKLEGIEKTSADITGDGKVNLVDVNRLINYIVYDKWEQEEIKTPKAPTINVITKKDENKDYYIGEVEVKIEEDKSTNNAKTTYIITGSIEQKETEIKEGEKITLTEPGEYLITAYTYGIKGNKSKGASKLVKVVGAVPNLTAENTIMTHTPKSWTKGPVTVSIQTEVEGYILQYSKDGVKWQDYTKEIEMTQNGKIYARLRNNLGDAGGKIGGNISNIDKVAPTVTLSPNGGDCYTMPSTGDAKINTVITAEDVTKTDVNGCSGLKTLQYAWSESKDTEPEVWTDFTNGSKVEKTDISGPGTWYLWTKVIDKAGNRAGTVKVSNPFIVKSNEDPANRITLTPDKTGWTNGNVTVTASFGKNLVQNKTLICSGTAGIDFVVNGLESVVVKTNGKKVIAIAQDDAGNTIGKELMVNNIDKIAPTVNASVSTTWTSGNKTITVSGADSDSGIAGYYVGTTNSTPSATASVWSMATTYSKGVGTYYVWSKDNAGNVSAVKQVEVKNIDTTVPEIVLSANSNTTWSKSKAVTVTLKDSESGLALGAVVKYGWSTSNTTEPTSYTNASISSYVAGAKTATFTATKNTETGKYYLWVKPVTLKNVVGESQTGVVKSTGTFYIDNTAPTVNASVSTTWTSGNKTITVSGADSDSGIAGYYVGTTNSTPSATVSGWSTATKYSKGLGTYYIWSKDDAGNVSAVKQVSVTNIDTTVPIIELSANSNTTWSKSKAVTVTLKDSESGLAAGAVVKYGWSTSNTVEPTSYTNASISSYTAGEKTATFTASINSGTGKYYLWIVPATLNNLLGESQTGILKSTGTFYIDNTAPTVDVTVPTNWTAVNKEITVSGADSNSGIAGYYVGTTNSTPSATVSGWSTATTYSKGVGTYYVWSKDKVGNVSAVKQVEVKNIDTTVPEIVLSANSNTTWAKSRSVTVTLKDNESGLALGAVVKYGWSTSKDTEPTSYTNATISSYSAGVKTATFTATKNTETGKYYLWVKPVTLKNVAGGSQTGVVKSTGTFYIDNTAPTNSLTASPAACANSNVTITANAVDNQSGIVAYQFSQNDSLTASSNGWKNTTSSVAQITETKEVTATGIWYFYVKDAVGNVSKEQIAIVIDKTPPKVEVPSETVAGTTVEVKASDAGSGVRYWAYSTSSDAPTAWTEIERANEVTIQFTPSLDITKETTYYIFVKDLAGNVSSTSIIVIPARWHNEKAKTSYTTLEGALLEANDEDTLKLLSSYEDTSVATVSPSKNVTLDTNGKTLTKLTNTIRIDEGATLNMQGNGTIESSSPTISIFNNYGTLNIKGGTIKSDYGVIWNEGTLNVTGGNLTHINGNGEGYSGIVINSGSANISGGRIDFNGIAIKVQGENNNITIGGSAVVQGDPHAIYCTPSSSGTINKGSKNISIDNQSTNIIVK